MQIGTNILQLIIILPVIGTLTLLVIPTNKKQLIKSLGFSITLLTFVLSLFLWILFDESTTQFQYTFSLTHWNDYSSITPLFGLDGISIFLILLTTLLIPICLLASWHTVTKLIKEFFLAFLVLESVLILVFCSLDLLIFYIFFEVVLIPMFLIIGIWGSRTRKTRASYLFFLYTLLGSLFMLLALLLLYFQLGTTDLLTIYNLSLEEKMNTTGTLWTEERQLLLWLAFFISFAIKVPMVPFHIWLPEAHVEAPTAGSVLLAGILLKLGTYGFIRILLPLFPDASFYFTPLVYCLSIIAIIYTSLTALRQIDLKKIIAYSSVAHMGFVTIGLFTQTIVGLEGAMLIMISHGFVSSALFLCVGVLYDRYHTRLIKYFGGLAQTMPIFTLILVFFSLANLGFPGTSSFPGELLTLLGTTQNSITTTILASTGMILGAGYSLWLCNRVLFGESTKDIWESIINQTDITKRELAVFSPLILLTIWMGVYPIIFLNTIQPAITNTIFYNLL